MKKSEMTRENWQYLRENFSVICDLETTLLQYVCCRDAIEPIIEVRYHDCGEVLIRAKLSEVRDWYENQNEVYIHGFTYVLPDASLRIVVCKPEEDV